jgi:hypothetical protein
MAVTPTEKKLIMDLVQVERTVDLSKVEAANERLHSLKDRMVLIVGSGGFLLGLFLGLLVK